MTDSPFQHPYPTDLRVRNYGEQSSEARTKGTTAMVKAVPRGDIYEYLVRRDQPIVPGGTLETWWPSYSTFVALDEYSREVTT